MSSQSIITFAVPSEKKKALRKRAKALDTDLSTILRELIDDYLGVKSTKQTTSQHPLLKALEILEDDPLREEFAQTLLEIRNPKDSKPLPEF